MRSLAHIATAALVLHAAACSSRPSPAGADPSRADGARLVARGQDRVARLGHAAALLGDGRVLLAGGRTGTGVTPFAEIFDPTTGEFEDAGDLRTARAYATATVLQDGRVLVAGGEDGAGNALASTELYDPATRTFSSAGTLGTPRAHHTANRLSDGTVVVIGGTGASAALSSVEKYTPGAATPWSPLAPLATPRTRHTATLLATGAILVAGGEDAVSVPVAAGLDGWAERYDPSSGGSTARTGGPKPGRSRHVAALLTTGQVLLAGGTDGTSALASWTLYDPATGTFTDPPGAVTGRTDATASVLPGGQVVVAGGANGAASADVDVYAPDGATAVAASAGGGYLLDARAGHAATILPSGRVLLTGGGLASAELLDRAVDRWTPLSPTDYLARSGHTATLLPAGLHAGMLLVAGGGVPGRVAYDRSCQLYDLETDTLIAGPELNEARTNHTATVLGDGSVLAAGGDAGKALDTAELFVETSDGASWATVPARMTAPRSGHTATLLSDGKVLLTGGLDENGSPLASAELYDPASRAFTATAGVMSAPRANHVARVLPNGTVLVAGGADRSADLYDPGTGTFTPTGSTTVARAELTATPLADGRVLLAGGFDGSAALASAELFDGTGAFAEIAGTALPEGRQDQAAALLPAGEVLLLFGRDASGLTGSVARYEPATQSFASALVTSLAEGRSGHTATLMPSGQILVWGGDDRTHSAFPELYDAASPLAPDPPVLEAVVSAVPGGHLDLSLRSGFFTGGTPSSDTRSADVNQPVFVLTRQDGDGIAYAETVRFDAGTARIQLPREAPAGWWWLRAIVGGVPGRAVPVKMLDPFRISPGAPSVPPRAPVTFTAAGGSGSYTWTPITSGSHDPNDAPDLPSVTTVDGTGQYQAGADPGVDTIQCADGDGNAVTVTITVGPRIAVTPASALGVAPHGTVAFGATGGCDPALAYASTTCTGYTWSYLGGDAGNRSGGTLGADGSYQAGAKGGVTDDLQVTDVLGNHAEVHVAVTEPLLIDPASIRVTPLGTTTFTASGGCDPAVYGAGLCPPYRWEILSPGSGPEASIDAAGVYHAGRIGSTAAAPVTDIVRVTDALGTTAEATVTLEPGVSLSPAAPATPPRGAIVFTASGGDHTFTGCTGTASPGSCWALVTNASGGTIDAAGHYTAGPTPNVTDVVQVEDTLGNTATVSVAVGPGITISPADAGAYPHETVTLTASGGSGTGFQWQLTTANGSLTPVAGTNTALYTGGATRGAIDLLHVTDDLGNEVTVDLVVWPDWRPAGSGCSSGGGSGGALALVLMALWLARRGRARRALAPVRAHARRIGIGAALVLAAAGARAQAPPVTRSFVVQRFQPAGGAYDLWGVQSAQTPGPLQRTFRLSLDYASRPLVLVAPGMHEVALLEAQLGADLTGSVGIADWAEVSLAVPIMLSQRREQSRFLPPELRQGVASFGLGDVRLTPKACLLDLGRLRLGASAPIGLPTGDRKAYLGHGGVTFAPSALIEVDALGPARVLLNAGAILRAERRLVDLTIGNAFTYGAGVEYPFTVRESRLAALATLSGEAEMKRSASSRPMELLAGVRWSSPGGLVVSAGGGPGIGKGYGTPRYRALLEVGYTTAGVDRLQETPRPKEEERPKAAPQVRAETAPQVRNEAAPAEPAASAPAKAAVPKTGLPETEPARLPETDPPDAEPPKPEAPAPQGRPEQEQPAPGSEPEALLRLDVHVFFDFNKKELKDEYKPVLRRLAEQILAEPRMRMIRIEGHADDLGPPEFNLWLSEERARTVKDFLENSGVPSSRFAIVGYGKTEPSTPGRSADARARNRRVDFTVQEY